MSIFFYVNDMISLLGLYDNLTYWYMHYIPLIDFNFKQTRWRMKDVAYVIRKPIFDPIKALQ